MPLKKKTKTVFIVDYGDLEAFVESIYGREFSITADQELGNDSDKFILVEEEELDEYDQNKLNNWKLTGKENWMFHTIMTDLCNQHLIPPGDYLIEISW